MFNKKWLTLLEIAAWLIIISMLLWTWYSQGMKFLNIMQKRSISDSISYVINDNINANSVWRWIERERIKKNILLIRDWENYIENYYYNETYRLDPVTLERSPTPITEFYWLERIDFPSGVEFKIPEEIEWYTLQEHDTEGWKSLIIRRTLPDNDLFVTDWYNENFQRLPVIDRNSFRNDYRVWKGYKELYNGETISDTVYYDLLRWSVPVELNNLYINIYYNLEKIGIIEINSEINYIEYRETWNNI